MTDCIYNGGPIISNFITLYCNYIYIYIVILLYINYMYIIYYKCGPGGSVGIATDYGLDGLGSNPGGG